ncbi:MAG TPA: sigma-70 family RNA polymerase sigma factor [Acidimicrobiales bacterium]|nr:sigma-70 family RNA polymerase sigma factor [Acidimicrobiales bacterium]
MEPSSQEDPEPVETPFEVFYRAQYAGIYAFVLRRLDGSREDVADVAAEVFATAWRRRDQLPPPPEDRPWIYGVAGRVLSRHRRGHGRRTRLLHRLQDQAPVGPRSVEPADDASPPARSDDARRVRSAMARLREADREVLALVLWDRLSHAEAGQVLGCSANAVAIRMHRARARLRDLLEEE